MLSGFRRSKMTVFEIMFIINIILCLQIRQFRNMLKSVKQIVSSCDNSATVFLGLLICSHFFQDHVQRSTGQLSEAVFTGEGWAIQLQCYRLPAAAVVTAHNRELLGPAGGSMYVCITACDICLWDMSSINNIWEKNNLDHTGQNHQVSY